jgi:uncharacterized protein
LCLEDGSSAEAPIVMIVILFKRKIYTWSRLVLVRITFFSIGTIWYLINIEGMSAAPIDKAGAEALAKVVNPAETPEYYLDGKLIKPDLPPEDKTSASPCHNAAHQESAPVVNMCLFLTHSCNLRCVYCYGGEGKYGTGGSMQEATAFKAVDWLIEQAGKTKKLHIGFFGG